MRRSAGLLLAVLTIGGWASAPAAERVYVGTEVCRECHDTGHRTQWSTWHRSGHARAWAALWASWIS